jgi:NADPH:quinone reductase-like Zn-dependent oxidoreductase
VGSNAIQLARAAGYDIVATASPRNHERARDLGASGVADYASANAVAEVVAAVAGRRVAGVLAIGTGSADPCVSIAVATGANRVALASPSVSFGDIPRRGGLSGAKVRTLTRLVARTSAVMMRSRLRGVRTRFVWGSTLMDNEVGPMLWERFLPGALADGRYTAALEADVVGSGLESIQPALDALAGGVSARKLVVEL